MSENIILLEDVAKELNVNMSTLRDAMLRLDMRSRQLPTNRRYRGLTRDEIALVAAKIAEMTGNTK